MGGGVKSLDGRKAESGLVQIEMQGKNMKNWITVGSQPAFASMIAMATALAVPTVAFAQDSEVAEAAASGEIVVTALRREQNLQEVPVAVSALGADALTKGDTISMGSLQGKVPGLMVMATSGSSNGAGIYLRGMGQDGSSAFDEPGVSIYQDGVYMGRPIGALFDLVGVERIEVLRGPQGTLYGRNSTSGAVKVVMKRPTTDQFSVSGDFAIGSFNRFDARAIVNIPVSDDVAVNIAGTSLTNDGYYRNPNSAERYNGKNTKTIRGALQWKGSSPLSLYITADFTADRSGIQVPTEMTPEDHNVPVLGNFFYADPGVPRVNRYNGGGVSAELAYDFGGATLQSITAYREFDYRISLDFNGLQNGLDMLRHSKQNQFSQELQLTGEIGDQLNYVAGLFFFREKSNEAMDFILDQAPLYTYHNIQTAKSYAAFAQLDYKPIDWLTLTAGGRYSIDEKEAERREPFITSGKKKWERFTPKLAASAQVTDDLLVYGSWQKGYKAGVFQPFPPFETANTTLNPELTTAWEAGFKAEAFDKKLRANVAFYNNTYNNLQLGVIASNGAVSITSADLRSRGVEVELTANPFDGLTLFSSFAVMDTKFTELPEPGSGLPEPGDKQKFAPPFSGQVGFDYVIPVGSDNEFNVGATLTWEQRNYQQYPNYLFPSEPYELVDLRAGYKNGDGWGVDVGIKNLTDKLYYSYSSQLSGFERYYLPGRTWYARVKFDI